MIPGAGDVLSKEFKYANGIPTLEDLGYEAKNISFKGGKGGETEGLRLSRGAHAEVETDINMCKSLINHSHHHANYSLKRRVMAV